MRLTVDAVYSTCRISADSGEYDLLNIDGCLCVCVCVWGGGGGVCNPNFFFVFLQGWFKICLITLNWLVL